MDQFPSNAKNVRTAAREPKKVEQVTSAEAARRPKGLGRRFKETFVGGDMRGAIHYMFVEVVVPAIQDTLIEAFQGGVERLIKGDSGHGGRRTVTRGYSSSSGAPQVNYQGMVTRGPLGGKSPSQPQRSLSNRAKTRHAFDELIIPSRQEALEVIDRMFDILARYGQVSVADLYALTGVESSHTDIKWGWTALPGARAQPLRQGGYLLDLPEPEHFD